MDILLPKQIGCRGARDDNGPSYPEYDGAQSVHTPMRIISVEVAAKEIQQTARRSEDRGEHPPFSFVVGAGISHPPLLLANRIADHCREEARRWGAVDEPAPNASSMDIYSHWFRLAYPQASDRQNYLRQMMERAHISRANFRLAHLLLDGVIGRVVITPNFDDLLTRAHTLFGRRPVVCDHPSTVERISAESRDIQIVHVHGSYWFYDCVNLTPEVSRTSLGSTSDSFTMPALLDDIFRSRMPLVLGYSGWEGDAIMGALRRRVVKPLPRNIYWFCYRDEEVQALPEWLREHHSFVAVVPMAGPGEEGASRVSTLEAARVLDALLGELQADVPALTKDPLGFFADQLRQSLWADDTGTASDVYAIQAVIERVERARRHERPPGQIERELDRVRDAVRRSDYRAAIRHGGDVSMEALPSPQLLELATSMLNAAKALLDNSNDEIEGYRLAIRACDVAGPQQPEAARTDVMAESALLLGMITRRFTAVRMP